MPVQERVEGDELPVHLRRELRPQLRHQQGQVHQELDQGVRDRSVLRDRRPQGLLGGLHEQAGHNIY